MNLGACGWYFHVLGHTVLMTYGEGRPRDGGGRVSTSVARPLQCAQPGRACRSAASGRRLMRRDHDAVCDVD